MAKKKTFSVQFAHDKRLATTKGHVVLFKAFTPREVSEDIYRQAIAEGGVDGSIEMKPAAGNDDEDPEPTGDDDGTVGIGSDSGVLEVARAMREIVEEADPDKLTSNHEPKVSVLSHMVGRDVTSDDRAEAQKLLDEGIV